MGACCYACVYSNGMSQPTSHELRGPGQPLRQTMSPGRQKIHKAEIRTQGEEYCNFKLLIFIFPFCWVYLNYGLDCGLDWWTGLMDWTDGLDWWTGLVDWTVD